MEILNSIFHSHRLSRIYNLKLCVCSKKRHSELHLWHSEFLHRCNAIYVVIRHAWRASTSTSVVSAPTLVLFLPVDLPPVDLWAEPQCPSFRLSTPELSTPSKSSACVPPISYSWHGQQVGFCANSWLGNIPL